MGAPSSDLSRMQSPNQLAQARAAYARARMALDRSRTLLKRSKGQVAARRALLDEAKCWGRLGESAERVREALESTVAESRKLGVPRSAEWRAKNGAAIARYWARISLAERAARGRAVAEGRRRAAEKRKRQAA